MMLSLPALQLSEIRRVGRLLRLGGGASLGHLWQMVRQPLLLAVVEAEVALSLRPWAAAEIVDKDCSSPWASSAEEPSS